MEFWTGRVATWKLCPAIPLTFSTGSDPLLYSQSSPRPATFE